MSSVKGKKHVGASTVLVINISSSIVKVILFTQKPIARRSFYAIKKYLSSGTHKEQQYMHQTCLVRESQAQVTIYGPGCSEMIRHALPTKNTSGKYVGRVALPHCQNGSPRLEEVKLRLQAMGEVQISSSLSIPIKDNS